MQSGKDTSIKIEANKPACLSAWPFLKEGQLPIRFKVTVWIWSLSLFKTSKYTYLIHYACNQCGQLRIGETLQGECLLQATGQSFSVGSSVALKIEFPARSIQRLGASGKLKGSEASASGGKSMEANGISDIQMTLKPSEHPWKAAEEFAGNSGNIGKAWMATIQESSVGVPLQIALRHQKLACKSSTQIRHSIRHLWIFAALISKRNPHCF